MANAVSDKQTIAEADFLIKTLDCASGSRLLDIPCGNGRHSLELAMRGYSMTGLDMSEQFIEEARARSQTIGAEIEWVLGDMRHIEREATFDGAFCMGNSFGYFVYSDTEAFLNGVSRALKPEARLVIGTGTAAECLLLNLKERTWYQIGDILFALENRYQAEESCLDTNQTYVRDGKVETRQSRHCVYTVGEIRRMLERAGLVVQDLYASLDCQPFTLGAPQLLVVAQKQR